MDDVAPPRDARGRLTKLPEPMRARLWQPGQSGNPSGKGGEYQRCIQLCRDASYESAQEIIRLRDHSDDDRVRFMAATWIYERAWGKAKEYDPKQQEDTAPKFDPSKLSPEQLAKVKEALLLMVQASAPEPYSGWDPSRAEGRSSIEPAEL